MEITKMHGLGNDFIVIDDRELSAGGLSALSAKLCRRRLSVGADGLIAVQLSKTADIRMRIINSDGSEAEMCGNGIRCFARFVYDRGIVKKPEFTVETGAGIMTPRLVIKDGAVEAVRVDMGKPSFSRADVPMTGSGDSTSETIEVNGERIEIGAVLMGVPHAYVPVKKADGYDVTRLGPYIEHHPVFPRRANVDFTEITDDSHIVMRTWERGAGPTLACGTGATGMVCLLHKKGLVGRSVYVQLEAGSLFIELADDGRAFMTGPAEYVFTGEAL